MIYIDGLVIILATFAGSAGGSLLTVEHYHRIAKERAGYEEEMAQSQEVLAGLALLRRTRTDLHWKPCRPGEQSSGSCHGRHHSTTQ
jgi:hypothetical protein